VPKTEKAFGVLHRKPPHWALTVVAYGYPTSPPPFWHGRTGRPDRCQMCRIVALAELAASTIRARDGELRSAVCGLRVR
jgi:hypothetical protein